MSGAPGQEIGGRKNDLAPLKVADLWKLAELLWRFRTLHDPEGVCQGSSARVHAAVVELASANERES